MNVPSLVYVLECESIPGEPARYYIGHTNNLQRRFEDHARGTGAAWTTKYRPRRPIEIRMGGDAEEAQLTLDYMGRCGIEYVRGGPWTSVALPATTVASIQTQLRASSGVCYKCGSSGHFAATCAAATRAAAASAAAPHSPLLVGTFGPASTPPSPLPGRTSGPASASLNPETGFLLLEDPTPMSLSKSLLDLAAAWAFGTKPASPAAGAASPAPTLVYSPAPTPVPLPAPAASSVKESARIAKPTKKEQRLYCERCGRNNHNVDGCYAKTHHVTSCSTECRHCGRLHAAPCYYKTDIEGEHLR